MLEGVSARGTQGLGVGHRRCTKHRMPRKQNPKPSRKPKPAVVESEREVGAPVRNDEVERDATARPHNEDVERGAALEREVTEEETEIEPGPPEHRGWEVHPDDVE